jgi:phage FluMu protein Com
MMEQTILELEVYMKMTCPHCGIVGSAHDSMPGEKVRCPQCDKVFKVTEQKIACPHCGVIGSARDSSVDMKLRCPQCEKVFLLTQELLTGPSVKGVMLIDDTDDLKRTLAEEARGVEPLAEEELLFPVPEPEPVLAPMAEVLPEPEREVAITPEPEPVSEIKFVFEPEVEPEPELMIVAALEPELELDIKEQAIAEPELAVVAAPEAELELEIEPEPEPELVLVATPELEPEPEPEPKIMVELLPEAESEPEIFPEPELDRTPPLADESKAKAEELESTAMPTRVCVGCGESFHPEFLQEIDAKLYCEVCQLPTAVLDIREKSPKIGDGKLRGTIGALLLLGLLALIVLALRMLGII